MPNLPLLTAALLVALPLAASADLASEYEQVRKIALRDAKVREAFGRANQRLDEKIVDIDPALAAYVRTHPAGRTEGRPVSTAPARAKAAPSAPPRKTHVVKAGETLSSIAGRYGISAQNLQGANRIRDERKLKVGQQLVVPR
jgi:membrane-bound lytic murein transglycosylase D